MGKMEQALKIVSFAITNNFTISPAVGYLYTIKNLMDIGCCPCDTDRKHCPCSEAYNEVTLMGKCKCGLFWSDLETFRKLEPTLA